MYSAGEPQQCGEVMNGHVVFVWGGNPVWVGRRLLGQGDGSWGRNRVAVEANWGDYPG